MVDSKMPSPPRTKSKILCRVHNPGLDRITQRLVLDRVKASTCRSLRPVRLLLPLLYFLNQSQAQMQYTRAQLLNLRLLFPFSFFLDCVRAATFQREKTRALSSLVFPPTRLVTCLRSPEWRALLEASQLIIVQGFVLPARQVNSLLQSVRSSSSTDRVRAPMSAFASRWAIPLGIGLMGAQASLVSVYGGQRAIIFDRFQGVKPEVGVHAAVWLGFFRMMTAADTAVM